MDVLLPRKELARAIALLKGTGKPPGIEPSVTLALGQEAITVAASGQEADMAVSLSVDMPGVPDTGANTTVPLAPLDALLKKFTGDMVTLNLAERTKLKLFCGSASAELTTQSQPFPMLADMPSGVAWVRVAAPDLANALRASYAAGTQAYQQALNGTQIELHEGALKVASTDGFRAAWSRCSAVYTNAPEGIALLTQKGVALLRAVSNTPDGEIDLTWDSKGFYVIAGAIRMRLPVLDGRLPNIDNVIPKVLVATVEVNRRAIVEAISRARILSDPANFRVDLTVGNNLLRIVGSGLHGLSDETLAATTTGDELTFAINGKVLTDALAADPQAELTTWRLSGTVTPMFIATGSHSALVVPLRVLN